MPRFFLWNIQGKALQQSIADLAREHAVDIIVLAGKHRIGWGIAYRAQSRPLHVRALFWNHLQEYYHLRKFPGKFYGDPVGECPSVDSTCFASCKTGHSIGSGPSTQ